MKMSTYNELDRLAKIEEATKAEVIAKRGGLEDILAMLAKQIKMPDETYEQAFVRATETKEGQRLTQAIRKLYVDTGI
jgi:hypothetical protein